MSLEWNKHTSARAAAELFKDQIRDKTIIVTGPSLLGLGFDTALSIAKQEPKVLVLAGRTAAKLEESKKEILKEVPNANIRFLIIDLSNMESVKQAAKEVNAYEEDIDVLINNAGTMDNPYTITPEGFEIQFAANYLGHWLFANSILPKMLSSKTSSKRIVNVSSSGHAWADVRYHDHAFKEGYVPNHAYGQSKTGNILFSKELARRYGDKGLVAMPLDPGGIETPLQKHWDLAAKLAISKIYNCYNEDGTINNESGIWKTTDQGASTSIRSAFDPTLVEHNGSYMVDCQPQENMLTPYAADPENAKRMWDFTNELLGTNFQ